MRYHAFTARFGTVLAMTAVVDGKGHDLVRAAITRKRGYGRRYVYYDTSRGRYVTERA